VLKSFFRMFRRWPRGGMLRGFFKNDEVPVRVQLRLNHSPKVPK
jgi:hypothetical protein